MAFASVPASMFLLRAPALVSFQSELRQDTEVNSFLPSLLQAMFYHSNSNRTKIPLISFISLLAISHRHDCHEHFHSLLVHEWVPDGR